MGEGSLANGLVSASRIPALKGFTAYFSDFHVHGSVVKPEKGIISLSMQWEVKGTVSHDATWLTK